MTYDACVLGLGYVGLTLATTMSDVGMKVLGVEKRGDIVDLTNKAVPHFREDGLEEMLQRTVGSGQFVAQQQILPHDRCDCYIITVGTPLDKHGAVRLDMIRAATEQITDHLQDGALVIIRSTVKIGTTREVVVPLLEASGKKFEIAVCPERTLEGKALVELRRLPQIVGADCQQTRDRAGVLFDRLTKTVIKVSSLETAETIKLADNTFRDVQFAFANEIARVCEAFDINACEVISLGKLGYPRTDIPLPGLVGGPCLEKDPHILIDSGREKGLDLEISRASRLVNERQPQETVDFIIREMERRKIPDDAEIAIIGLAFKGVPQTDDLRGSMAKKVIENLMRWRPRLRLRIFDPVVQRHDLERDFPECQVCDTYEQAIECVSVVVISNNNPIFEKYDPKFIKSKIIKNGFIYDYWNFFEDDCYGKLEKFYFSVGSTRNKK